MMADYNEAIKNLQTVQGMPLTIRLAIEALEKQIPKKPVRDNEWHFNLLCPRCNRKIADTEHLWDIQRQYLEEQEFRCPCGQAIDWSDDEET